MAFELGIVAAVMACACIAFVAQKIKHRACSRERLSKWEAERIANAIEMSQWLDSFSKTSVPPELAERRAEAIQRAKTARSITPRQGCHYEQCITGIQRR